MKLSISKCTRCNRARLVDNFHGKWICFACKQKLGKEVLKKIAAGAEMPLLENAQKALIAV